MWPQGGGSLWSESEISALEVTTLQIPSKTPLRLWLQVPTREAEGDCVSMQTIFHWGFCLTYHATTPLALRLPCLEFIFTICGNTV